VLKYLKLKNFKSHKETLLEFCSGVNVIRGNPRSGKTNIFRAGLWLFTNRPTGGEILSNFVDGGGDVEVEVGLWEGGKVGLKKHVVINKEGKKEVKDRKGEEDSKAIYTLDGNEYKAFATDVPDLIQRKLNLTELNFQKQLDKHFLVTSPPGEIARTLNRITKLEPVDARIKRLTSKVNSGNREVRLLEEQAGEIESEITKYSDIEETGKIVQQLQTVAQRLEEKDKQSIELRGLISKTEVVDYEISELDSFLEVEAIVCGIEEIDQELEQLQSRSDLLNQIHDWGVKIEVANSVLEMDQVVDRIDEIDKRIDSIQVELTLLIQIQEMNEELTNLVSIGGELEPIYEHLEEIDEQISLCNALCEIQALDLGTKDLVREEEEARQAYVALIKKLGKCPTCFSPANPKLLERIMENV